MAQENKKWRWICIGDFRKSCVNRRKPFQNDRIGKWRFLLWKKWITKRNQWIYGWVYKNNYLNSYIEQIDFIEEESIKIQIEKQKLN